MAGEMSGLSISAVFQQPAKVVTEMTMKLTALLVVAAAFACNGTNSVVDSGTADAGDGGHIPPPSAATCPTAPDGGSTLCPDGTPICMTVYDSITGPSSSCVSLDPCGNNPTCTCFQAAPLPLQCNCCQQLSCKVIDGGIYLGCGSG